MLHQGNKTPAHSCFFIGVISIVEYTLHHVLLHQKLFSCWPVRSLPDKAAIKTDIFGRSTFLCRYNSYVHFFHLHNDLFLCNVLKIFRTTS